MIKRTKHGKIIKISLAFFLYPSPSPPPLSLRASSAYRHNQNKKFFPRTEVGVDTIFFIFHLKATNFFFRYLRSHFLFCVRVNIYI